MTLPNKSICIFILGLGTNMGLLVVSLPIYTIPQSILFIIPIFFIFTYSHNRVRWEIYTGIIQDFKVHHFLNI